MANEQFIRKTPAELAIHVGRPGQIVINSETDQMIVCNGQTPGGVPQAKASNFNATIAVTSGTLTIENGSIVDGLITE